MKWRLDDGQIEVLDPELARVLRQKTPAQRVAMVGQANRTARQLCRAAIRRRHPDWNDTAIEQDVAQRMLGHGTT